MKRYRIEQRRPYADDPEAVEEVAVEDAAGDWVPADVAQGLHDALERALDSVDDETREALLDALAEARGE